MRLRGGSLAWFGVVAMGCVVSVPPGFEDTDGGDTTDTTDTTDDGPGPDPVGATARVLVLDEGGEAEPLIGLLEDAGHSVTVGPNYREWDGSNPRFTGDTIVIVQVTPDAPAIPRAADTALMAFFEGGGGIVRTGTAALVADVHPGAAIDVEMNVGWRDGTEAGLDWWVTERNHALVADVPERWTEAGTFGYLSVVDDPLTVPIMEAKPGDWPVVVGRVTRAKGRVVYLNNDFGANGGVISPQVGQLLDNAVVWAANL